MPGLARVAKLAVAQRPALRALLDLVAVVDAHRAPVSEEIIEQGRHEAPARHAAAVDGEDAAAQLRGAIVAEQPRALGQQQRAVREMRVAVALAADVLEEIADREGLAEGLLGDVEAGGAERVDHGAAMGGGRRRIDAVMKPREIEIASFPALVAAQRSERDRGGAGSGQV